MRVHNMIKGLSSIAMIFTMLSGIAVIANAQSGYGRYEQYGQYGQYGDEDRVRWSKDRTRQYAFLFGYHQAYTIGSDLRDRGFRGNVKDTPEYRNDINGFMSWMGYRDDYRDRYRKGYEEGFRDAQNFRQRRYDRDDVERVLGARLKDVYGDGRGYDDDRYGRGRDDRYRDRDDRYRDRDDRYRDRDDRGRYNRQEIYRLAQQQGYQDGLRRGQDDRRNNRRSDIDRISEYRDGMRGYRSEYGDRYNYQQGYREGFRRGYDEGFRNSGSGSRWPRWPF